MLADRVSVRTRRCLEALGGEAEAWHFETDGIGSFGELRRARDWTHGTEVRLRLKPEAATDALADWIKVLAEFLKQQVLYTPCPLTLEAPQLAAEPLALPRGWTTSTDDLTHQLETTIREQAERSILGDPPESFVVPSEKAEHDQQIENLEDALNDLVNRIRWTEQVGDLPSGQGRYRVAVPYFELSGGVCLSYCRVLVHEGRTYLRAVGPGRIVNPYFQPPTYSLSGVRIAEWRPDWESNGGLSDFYVAIDFATARAIRLLASREFMRFSMEQEDLTRWVMEQAKLLIKQLLAGNRLSEFARINALRAERMGVNDPDGVRDARWLVWEPIDGGWLPLLRGLALPNHRLRLWRRNFLPAAWQPTDAPSWLHRERVRR